MQTETDFKGLKELAEQLDDRQILMISLEVDEDGAGIGSGEYEAGKGTVPV